MAALKLVSADSHVNEPGDLWVERINQPFRQHVPRIVENPPGQRPGAYLILKDMPPSTPLSIGRLSWKANIME